MEMTWRRGLVTAAAVVVASGVCSGLTQVDWASYGPAKPPTADSVIDTSAGELTSLVIGKTDVLKEPARFVASQIQPVRLTATVVPDTFGSFSITVATRKRTSQQTGVQEHLLYTPHAGLGIYRRSSLGTGATRVGVTIRIASIDRNNRLKCDDDIRIPDVPGLYRLDVFLLGTRRVNGGNDKIEKVIHSFPLEVLPPTVSQ
jgi:hypothetical protein